MDQLIKMIKFRDTPETCHSKNTINMILQDLEVIQTDIRKRQARTDESIADLSDKNHKIIKTMKQFSKEFNEKIELISMNKHNQKFSCSNGMII